MNQVKPHQSQIVVMLSRTTLIESIEELSELKIICQLLCGSLKFTCAGLKYFPLTNQTLRQDQVLVCR